MNRRVITTCLVVFALFAWPGLSRSADIAQAPSAIADSRSPQSYSYGEAVDLGLVRPIPQKLPWCTGEDSGYGSFAEANAAALDPPACQANPEGATAFVGGLLSKPVDFP
jgi:hypothetical protein